MEAAILQFFESLRNPFLDQFFGIFSLFGEAMVVGGAAILLFWLLPRKSGERVIMTALTSFPINSLLKFLVARPRPYIAGAVEYGNPFLADALDPYASFPSGHTQSLSSLLFSASPSPGRKKRRANLALMISCAVVLLVMLARLYFGAHYPSDVLAGLLFGVAVSVLWRVIFLFAHPYRYLILLVFAALSAFPCLLSPAHDYIQATGLLMGASVALALGHFILAERDPAPFPRRLWRIPVGAALVGVALALSLLFPEGEGFSLLKWFLIAFTAGLPAPYAFEKLAI